jgi:hypothetical protein
MVNIIQEYIMCPCYTMPYSFRIIKKTQLETIYEEVYTEPKSEPEPEYKWEEIWYDTDWGQWADIEYFHEA